MGSVKLHPCGQCLRFTLVIWNIFVLMIGAVAIGVGIWQIVANNNYEHLTGQETVSGGIVSIVAGVVAIAVAMLGIFGAVALSRVLLGIYAGIVVLFVVLELTSGILGFVYRDNLDSAVTDNARESISGYYTNRDDRSVIDAIQDDFDCCGWDNYTDWETLNGTNFNGTFPTSCECGNGTFASANDIKDCEGVGEQYIYTTGCRDSVVSFLREYQLVVGALGITFGVIQAFVVAISLILCGCVHKARGEYTTV